VTRAEVLAELVALLARRPEGFVDDGCSAAPDRIFGRELRPACIAHDLAYCSRAWPAGALDQAHRLAADQALGRRVRALLPLGLGWIGWIYWRAVHRFGGDAAFDSCGAAAGPRCRHGLAPPEWMARAQGRSGRDPDAGE
jgi:hypothetical protein